ncbi:MAG: FecR family protein, partial [Steroidobacteraceae bacterium]
MMQGKHSHDEAARRLDAAEWWLRLQEDVPPETLSGWLEWRARDSRNAEVFDDVQHFAAHLRSMDGAAADSLVAQFAPTQQQDPSQDDVGLERMTRQRGAKPWIWLGAAAATLLVALGGGALWHFDGIRPVPEERSYATDIAMNREIVMADGSRLTLGGASRATSVVDAEFRQVHLEAGQAYFEVARDARRPFLVDAGGVTVRAVGTAFDVRAAGAQVAVTVTHGLVRVGATPVDRADLRAPSIDAAAGQQVVYDSRERTLTISAVDPQHALSWRENRLEFESERLDIVIDNINRYSRTPLRIRDAELGAVLFTGTVVPPRLDDWLAALPHIFP